MKLIFPILTSKDTTSGGRMSGEESAWEELLSSAARLQDIVFHAKFVGQRVIALRLAQQFSRDGDDALVEPREGSQDMLSALESIAGWKPSRIGPRVPILGNPVGLETGVRQLIRT